MTDRENLLSLLRRQGYERIPADMSLCPHLEEQYRKHIVSKGLDPELDFRDYFRLPWRNVDDLAFEGDSERFRAWHRPALQQDAYIDGWGIGHEKGSAAAMHMTRMRHPLQGLDSLEEIQQYPFPRFRAEGGAHQKKQAEEIQARGLAAVGSMQCTVWETAWYLRSMEDLMVDMLSEDPIAEYLLDTVTDAAVLRAESFARAGVDILFLGDDIGTQSTIMPFGTADEVQKAVRDMLDIAGDKGGLFAAPTHVLEPEVPFENILASRPTLEINNVKGRDLID